MTFNDLTFQTFDPETHKDARANLNYCAKLDPLSGYRDDPYRCTSAADRRSGRTHLPLRQDLVILWNWTIVKLLTIQHDAVCIQDKGLTCHRVNF